MVRVASRYGWTRSARVVAVVVWTVFLANALVAVRPDLLYPDDIGSDSANYVASTERLVDGGPIYGLRAGDRPVPADNAPDWAVPILAPPTVPTLYLPTLLAPAPLRPYVIWSVGLAGTIAAGYLVALTAPLRVLAIALFLAPGLAATAWSGNANALIAAGIPIVFAAGTSTNRRVAIAGGVVLGAITLLKIGPILLIAWLIGSRRWIAVATALGTVAVGLAATAVIAGIGAFLEFIDVVRHSMAQPSTWSIPGIATRLGLPPPGPMLALLLLLAAVAFLALRDPRRSWAFVVSALGAVIATTVVRIEGIAVGVVSGVAYRATEAPAGVPTDVAAREASPGRFGPGWRASVAGVAIAAGSVVGSIAAGGLQSSSVTITNATDEAVVVRFGVVAQAASYGYVVEPGASVTAWREQGGSAHGAYYWTADCRLVAELVLPRSGGHLLITDGGLQLESLPRAGYPLAPPSDRCSLDLKRRLESVQATG